MVEAYHVKTLRATEAHYLGMFWTAEAHRARMPRATEAHHAERFRGCVRKPNRNRILRVVEAHRVKTL